MGMTLSEIEVGKDYRLGTRRIRAVAIEKLEERSGYGRRRSARHVKYVDVDTETGEVIREDNEGTYTLAKNINQPWDEFVRESQRHQERNAPRVAGENKVTRAIQELFLFEGQPLVGVKSHLRRRYYSHSDEVDFDAQRYVVEITVPDVFVERFVAVLENAFNIALPVPERLSEKAMQESDET